jgi:predicted nucleotidyltransferase
VTTTAPREEFRQWPTVQKIPATVRDEDEVLGAFLVGSFAADAADSVSDVDLIVVALDGAFSAAWEQRDRLHATGALASWDEHDGVFEEAAVHVWLTPDIVLVEALIATLSSGAPGIPTRMCGQVTVG